MNRSALFAIVCLSAAAWTLGAQAQPAPQSQSGEAPPPGYGQGSSPAAEMAPWPVTMVTSVEVLRSERAGGFDLVRVRGLVSSSGWGLAASDSDHAR